MAGRHLDSSEILADAAPLAAAIAGLHTAGDAQGIFPPSPVVVGADTGAIFGLVRNVEQAR
eukprot:3637642-Alexandrium_andersonii.AAC.1